MKVFLNSLFLSLFVNIVFAQTTIISLNSGWSFNQSGKPKIMPATVPGCVQSDLLVLNKIPNPYIGLNEDKVKWIEQEDWVYNKTFEVSSALLQNDKINLVFEGLDTYAEVFINGKSALNANNMFRKWIVDAKPFLKLGKNEIKILFKSTVKTAEPLATATHIKYPADNEKSTIKISPFVRKGAFQFGWDFAPRLLTAGIWKPVYIEAWHTAKIEDVSVQLQQLDKKSANYLAKISVNILKKANYTYTVRDKKSGQILLSNSKLLNVGQQELSVPFAINNPKLWWPNGLGNQHLYALEFSLLASSKTITKKGIKLGVRQIEVVNKPDSLGESFYLKVNGIPVFMKGSNYVPVSSLVEKSSKQKLQNLFASMKESHANMIRVWGGGFYADDDFYNLADENGILVWQDFMFACTMYPSNQVFLDNVRQEAIDNIKRIRNHPSLALWCGNNEIAVGWKNWGWQKANNYSVQDSLELINGYNKLFKEMLPNLVKQYDGGRFYFHSSPISNWGKAEDFKYGDNHYWGVYHGEQPFSAYETHIPRFNSEYGFQSFPSWQTLQQITQDEKPSLTGDVLTQRQKSYKGNKLLAKYMDWYYQKPQNDETFVYLSQLQQAEGMKTAIEANRRATPFCMGSLVWQLNDTWPAISWSSIEYNGQWKAAQYFIKKAFEPIILSVKEEKDSLLVYVVSDKLQNFKADVEIQKWTMNAKTATNIIYPKMGFKGGNSTLIKVPLSAIRIENKASNFVVVSLRLDDKVIAAQNLFFNPVKDLNLPMAKINYQIKENKGKKVIELTCDVLAKNVCLSLDGESNYHFSDNYFDVLPQQKNVIELKSTLSVDEIKQKLRLMQVKNQKL